MQKDDNKNSQLKYAHNAPVPTMATTKSWHHIKDRERER